jgi:hypothetical protein
LYIEYTSPWTGFELTTLVVIGTNCTSSCKSSVVQIEHLSTHLCVSHWNFICCI